MTQSPLQCCTSMVRSSVLMQASSSLSMGRTRAWSRGSLHQKFYFRHFFALHSVLLQKNAGMATADRKMLHYCPHHVCAGPDPDNFRSNRKEVNNMDILDKSKIFPYRTIGLRDNLEPYQNIREFSRYVARIANRKASGDDKMPADLFKKAPEAFRKRAWILINIILAGHYVCSEKLPEARVVLLRTMATRRYWQTTDQLHSVTRSTNSSTSSLPAGFGASQKSTQYWNPRSMASEAPDLSNSSFRKNAGS